MDWTGGSPRGTPLGQDCPCLAKRGLARAKGHGLLPPHAPGLAKDGGEIHAPPLGKGRGLYPRGWGREDMGYTHVDGDERTGATHNGGADVAWCYTTRGGYGATGRSSGEAAHGA
ncbi:hypothetical protein DP117_23850 [Brasilonema sp. UFV-L1]|nr:hypothetical protein [Brasilonema sp. UFV-L1]